ncbi:MAG TPA: hypothetical protein VKR59_13135 [Terriglobales bacterium]|nr:hypothetical protein [Terriglobales bacterium]
MPNDFSTELLDARPSNDDLEKVAFDALETYTVAASKGELSTAASALRVRLAALNQRTEREAEREKRDELLASADPCEPETWSPELANFIRRYTDNILLRLDQTRKLHVKDEVIQ